MGSRLSLEKDVTSVVISINDPGFEAGWDALEDAVEELAVEEPDEP